MKTKQATIPYNIATALDRIYPKLCLSHNKSFKLRLIWQKIKVVAIYVVRENVHFSLSSHISSWSAQHLPLHLLRFIKKYIYKIDSIFGLHMSIVLVTNKL